MPSPLCRGSTFMLLRFSLSVLHCFLCNWKSTGLAKKLLRDLYNHDIPLFVLAEARWLQESQKACPAINLIMLPGYKCFSFLVVEPVLADFWYRAFKTCISNCNSLAVSARSSPNLFDVVIILFGIATQFNFHL